MRVFPLLIPVLCIISACASPKPTTTDGGAIYRVIDFRPYAEKNFLFTTEAPNGEYSSRGLVQVDLIPKITTLGSVHYDAFKSAGHLQVDDVDYVSVQEVRLASGEFAYYGVARTNIQAALDEMYELAVEMEADAVTKLNIENQTIIDTGLVYTVIKVTGFAIRRN